MLTPLTPGGKRVLRTRSRAISSCRSITRCACDACAAKKPCRTGPVSDCIESIGRATTVEPLDRRRPHWTHHAGGLLSATVRKHSPVRTVARVSARTATPLGRPTRVCSRSATHARRIDEPACGAATQSGRELRLPGHPRLAPQASGHRYLDGSVRCSSRSGTRQGTTVAPRQ